MTTHQYPHEEGNEISKLSLLASSASNSFDANYFKSDEINNYQIINHQY